MFKFTIIVDLDIKHAWLAEGYSWRLLSALQVSRHAV